MIAKNILRLRHVQLFKRVSSPICLTVLIFCSRVIADEVPTKNVQNQITFYAMGDVPYTPEEDIQLPGQIAQLPSNAGFVVHLGDIKGGAAPCHEEIYFKVARMLSKATSPVFIIPGDNEWNDCVDPDPIQAWKYWEKHFMRFEQRWRHNIPVFRQLQRQENFSFVRNEILFIGINIVGGRVHDTAEWKQRHIECLEWIDSNLKQFGQQAGSVIIFGHANPAATHQDFFMPLNEVARQFGKPILYLHGDGHRWLHDRPFMAKNILRVQVDQGGQAPPLKVTVTDHPTDPFVFDRRMISPEQ